MKQTRRHVFRGLRVKPQSYRVVDAFSLAEMLDESRINVPIRFFLDDPTHLSPWEAPEVYSLEKTRFGGTDMVFATRGNGGVKMRGVPEMLPPGRIEPIPYDYMGFIMECLAERGAQSVVIIEGEF